MHGRSPRDERGCRAAHPLSRRSGVAAEHRGDAMGTYTTKDGVDISYKDWGSGQPVVFSHGWPLTSDAWDPQLNLVASAGYRAIAHDRRGGGRASHPGAGE